MLARDQEAAPALADGLHLHKSKPRSARPSSPSTRTAAPQPFEVFINTAKAGSETAAVSEAIGRLISYILRLASPIVPPERLEEVVRQLAGHRRRAFPGLWSQPGALPAGWRGAGTGPSTCGRRKDAAARESAHEKSNGTWRPQAGSGQLKPPRTRPLRIGDLCPECGEAAVVNEEGCRKCYACGFSEC